MHEVKYSRRRPTSSSSLRPQRSAPTTSCLRSVAVHCTCYRDFLTNPDSTKRSCRAPEMTGPGANPNMIYSQALANQGQLDQGTKMISPRISGTSSVHRRWGPRSWYQQRATSAVPRVTPVHFRFASTSFGRDRVRSPGHDPVNSSFLPPASMSAKRACLACRWASPH